MTEKVYTKQERLNAIALVRNIVTTQDTQLTAYSDEYNLVMYSIEVLHVEPFNGDMFNSGHGSGCGAFTSYEINETFYDVVVPDVAFPEKFSIVRIDPIDWDAKVREVELSD